MEAIPQLYYGDRDAIFPKNSQARSKGAHGCHRQIVFLFPNSDLFKYRLRLIQRTPVVEPVVRYSASTAVPIEIIYVDQETVIGIQENAARDMNEEGMAG